VPRLQTGRIKGPFAYELISRNDLTLRCDLPVTMRYQSYEVSLAGRLLRSVTKILPRARSRLEYFRRMEQSPHILFVEDDPDIRGLVADFLEHNGYRLSVAKDGRDMDRVLGVSRIDLLILDIMLPKEDGLSLCRRVRASSNVPIIMLTARASEVDRIVGLEIGADDYLTKPFGTHELLARIRALLRRAQSVARTPQARQRSVLQFVGWKLDVGTRRLTSADGAQVPLTGGEFELLAAFCERPNRVLTRDQLLDLTRGRSPALFERSIDIQVSRLRRKIEADPKDPLLIQTVRSGGYIFTPEVTAA
jgi:two-component system OmpR family response regulator